MWWLLFLSLSAVAAPDLDLSAIRNLEDNLPAYESIPNSPFEKKEPRPSVNFDTGNVEFETIKQSGLGYGSLKEGTILTRIEDNKSFRTTFPIYTKFYRLTDDLGFYYLVSKEGNVQYKVHVDRIDIMGEELVMHEPPRVFTPAPKQIYRPIYDTKLSYVPEAVFYAGLVQADFMEDLYNDYRAKRGRMIQAGGRVYTNWETPIMVGAALVYERAQYGLSDGIANYEAVSFGPMFKTKNFDLGGWATRLQTQIRVSPFAKIISESDTSGRNLARFNSADFQTALEHPIKNDWGEYTIGLFVQIQWLSIKSQSRTSNLQANNESNKSFGLAFSQVFP